MTTMERENWIVNIECAAAEATNQVGAASVDFVFAKYGATSVEDLSESFYSEVWDELDMMAYND